MSMADSKDPNAYKQQLERERRNITKKDEETGEYRIKNIKDRKDLLC